MLCLYFSANAQIVGPTNLKIGDKMPDVLLTNIMNTHYKTARLSDFKGKLVIIDFWAVWCGSCINSFPELDSMQRMFPKNLQVLLVNPAKERNTVKQVNMIIARVNAWSPLKLKVPIVFQDTAITRYFKFRTIPTCAWIGPDGRLIGMTDNTQVTAANIKKIINGEPLKLPYKDDFSAKATVPKPAKP